MPPQRLARTQFAWSGETQCAAHGYDPAHRLLGSMRVELGVETQREIAKAHGSVWRLRIEESLLQHLPRVLDLRYGTSR